MLEAQIDLYIWIYIYIYLASDNRPQFGLKIHGKGYMALYILNYSWYPQLCLIEFFSLTCSVFV